LGKKRKPLPTEPVAADIESLSHDGRGVCHVEGKAVFVPGALPGEKVLFRYTRRARRHDEGVVEQVLTPAPERVAPRCAHFGVCGGCALQHMDPAAQVHLKQGLLAEALARIGKVEPLRWLPPLSGEPWGYRRKARLGVRFVAKKGRVLVGFRERGSAFVADLARCDVLRPEMGERLPALAALVESLSIRERVAQIEVAQGDGPTVLIFRVLDPPTETDRARLLAFAAETGLHVYLQPGGADSVAPLPGQAVRLSYRLPAHGVEIGFEPFDFTQVNLELNRLMVDQALELLDPQPDERVLDLFCGLGNFTLPIARRAAAVVGVEGDAGLAATPSRTASATSTFNRRTSMVHRAPRHPGIRSVSTRPCWTRRAPAPARYSTPSPPPACAASSTSPATRRRSPATRRTWCTRSDSGWWPPARWTCFRTRLIWSRWHFWKGRPRAKGQGPRAKAALASAPHFALQNFKLQTSNFKLPINAHRNRTQIPGRR